MLSFASGIMLYISYGDLLTHAMCHLGLFAANCWLFVGMALMWVVVSFVPEPDLSQFAEVSDKTDKPATAAVENGSHAAAKRTPARGGARKRRASTPKDDGSAAEAAAAASTTLSHGHSHGGDALPKAVEAERSGDNLLAAKQKSRLMMTGLIAALGISLHNFPEGLVVFNATLSGAHVAAYPL